MWILSFNTTPKLDNWLQYTGIKNLVKMISVTLRSIGLARTWEGFLTKHDFVISRIGHLENTGSELCRSSNTDTFHHILFKKTQQTFS